MLSHLISMDKLLYSFPKENVESFEFQRLHIINLVYSNIKEEIALVPATCKAKHLDRKIIVGNPICVNKEIIKIQLINKMVHVTREKSALPSLQIITSYSDHKYECKASCKR